MRLDDAKTYWWGQHEVNRPPLPDSTILARVMAESRRFDRRVRFRDAREAIAAAIAVILIAPSALHATLLTRLGVAVLVAALVVMTIRLSRARRVPGAGNMALSTNLLLKSERAKVDTQIRLLESVVWWYLGPTWMGVVMIIAGRAGASWLTLGSVGAVTVVLLVLYRLNLYAARHHLRPLRDELSLLLAQMDARSDSSG